MNTHDAVYVITSTYINHFWAKTEGPFLADDLPSSIATVEADPFNKMQHSPAGDRLAKSGYRVQYVWKYIEMNILYLN